MRHALLPLAMLPRTRSHTGRTSAGTAESIHVEHGHFRATLSHVSHNQNRAAQKSRALLSSILAPLTRRGTWDPKVATRDVWGGNSPQQPSPWGPQTRHSRRHNPSREQGSVHSTSQRTGGSRTGKGPRTLPSIPHTLPGSWEAAGTSRTKSPRSSSRPGGHLQEGKERTRGHPWVLPGDPHPSDRGAPHSCSPQLPWQLGGSYGTGAPQLR